MKSLFFGIAALLVGLPSYSEAIPVQIETIPIKPKTVYLFVLYRQYYPDFGLDTHSLPMESFEQCELSGARLISSERLKMPNNSRIGYECIEGS